MSLRPDRLTRFPLFAKLPQALLAEAARFCTRRSFVKGALLFRQGDAASSFHLIEDGRVKVYRVGGDGREQILHLVEPGESFAEVAVLSLPDYPAHALALEDVKSIEVPREPFHRFIDAHAEAARALLAGQAMWLRRLVDLSALLMLEDAGARLARFLVQQAGEQGLALVNGARVALTAKKHLIAARLGAAPETLSRAFARLEDEGLIAREGRQVLICDARALAARAYPELD